jgi:type I restriction enzyme R subunit
LIKESLQPGPACRPKESVKAGLRSKVRRLLVINGYPPDLEERAIELVLEQAELFAEDSA